jgi:hypothetical protein
MLTQGSIPCIFCFGETRSFVPQDDREYVVIIIIGNLIIEKYTTGEIKGVTFLIKGGGFLLTNINIINSFAGSKKSEGKKW